MSEHNPLRLPICSLVVAKIFRKPLEILGKTGLKSVKTLTRWYQKGIIPKPLIRTHPSGHGKMAYWPNWVLERCTRIDKLRKQGYSVKETVLLIDFETTEEELEAVKKTTDY